MKNPTPFPRARPRLRSAFTARPAFVLVSSALAQTNPGRLTGIVAFNWSPDVSTEGLTDGFTHSFIFTFESVAARDAYLPHPVHQAAVKVVIPRLARVIVVDQLVN